MINTGQHDSVLPVVGWQGEEAKSHALFRLEELRASSFSLTNGFAPKDGHNPREPHFIDFHALLLVTHGSFEHWLDFQTHRFSRNQLIYIAPNQIHHFIKRKRAHRAWIVTFRPEILPAGLLQLEGKQTPWSTMCYQCPSITKLKPAEAGLLEKQMEFLNNLQLNYPDCLGPAAQHHVCAIIALAFELAKKNHDDPIDWQSNRRFFEFVQLVELFFASHREVKWYAKKMDCSQRTLSRVCQRATGKSAKALLTERVVVEGKRLLTYTGDIVNSVSEQLGFGETTNFVRYFKNETGMTPQEFRSMRH